MKLKKEEQTLLQDKTKNVLNHNFKKEYFKYQKLISTSKEKIENRKNILISKEEKYDIKEKTSNLSKEKEDIKKTFWKHLEETKNLFLKVFFAWMLGTIIGYFFSNQIIQFLIDILKDNNHKLILIRPTDGFLIFFKISIITGFLISLPINLIFVWNFVKTALKTKEKIKIIRLFIYSLFLSIISVLYGYFSLIPGSLDILLKLNPVGTTVSLTLLEYIDFLIFISLALIATFQLPLISYFLIENKIVKLEVFTKNRKKIYFVIVLFTAIITPTPDIFTLALFSIPLILLLEIAIILGKKNINLN